ncbi:MAG TPA: non-canonical purine NTP pyrophosphatase, partial [Allosphingosinicella sp.]
MAHRRLQPGKLVLASHNAGKLREVAALVAPHGMQVVSAGELGLAEPAET